ncbi:hypothetical protein FQN54_003585 [Arachnomyces sp. PD_36]|nr:hypothetical protein FQN54_003585 [Arachnomyces sp. PD_36]
MAGASSVAITDHPSSSALGPNGAILKNLEKNVPEALRSRASIHPHEWGDVESPFAQNNKGSFTRVIAADCLWVGGEHKNLVKTLLWFLSEGNGKGVNGGSLGGDSSGRAWVVAGFHTGREIVASFFDTAVEMGLEIEDIWERDINPASGEDGEPVIKEREWKAFREDEGLNERSRWHVMAVLKRQETKHGNGISNGL